MAAANCSNATVQQQSGQSAGHLGCRILEAGKSSAQVAREHGIDPSLPSRWRQELARYSWAAFAGQGNLYKDEARIAHLEMELSQLHAEKILLQRALAMKKKKMPGEKGESQILGKHPSTALIANAGYP